MGLVGVRGDQTRRFVGSAAGPVSLSTTTYTSVLSLPLPTAAANYLVTYSAEVRRVGNSAVAEARVVLNTTEVAQGSNSETVFQPFSGVVSLNTSAGVKTLRIEFRSTVAGRAVEIRRAMLVVEAN
jgi:hypothetical protein